MLTFREWPTQPGWYWFMGIRFKGSPHHGYETALVCMKAAANGTLIGVSNGGMIYKSEVGEHLWAFADVPDANDYLGE